MNLQLNSNYNFNSYEFCLWETLCIFNIDFEKMFKNVK